MSPPFAATRGDFVSGDFGSRLRGRCFAGAKRPAGWSFNRAVDTLPRRCSLFYANRQFLVEHVGQLETDPKTGTAATRISFNWITTALSLLRLPRDYNAAISKFNRKICNSTELLPWEIGLLQQKANGRFPRNHDGASGTAAAIFAHYMKAAQILSTPRSIWKENCRLQPGVNERFSSGLVDRYRYCIFFVKPNEAVYIHDPTDHAFELLKRRAFVAGKCVVGGTGARTKRSPVYAQEYYDRFYSLAGAILVRQLSGCCHGRRFVLDDILDQRGPAQLPR